VDINLEILERKSLIEHRLNLLIEKVYRKYSFSDVLTDFEQDFKDYCLRQGKRIRGLLLVDTYLRYGGKDEETIYECAAILELIHNFILIHDDLIDEADFRRGGRSLHVLLEDNVSAKLAKDLALVLGDVIFAFGIKSFLKLKVSLGRKHRALNLLMDIAVLTGCGEIRSLVDSYVVKKSLAMVDIYRIYDLKTARYSFLAPLKIGAILAGASYKEIKKLERVSKYLGRAYQIQNDLDEVIESADKLKRAEFLDLKGNKKTILYWYVSRFGSKDQKDLLVSIFSKKNKFEADYECVRNIYAESGAIGFAKDEIRKCEAIVDESGFAYIRRAVLIRK
jgi:geranylgeranyl diphosphate synthase, type I